jgi:DNA-binding MarR family transcriptional regulator
MNLDITDDLASIHSAISRVNGLYGRWAQKQNINFYTMHIFYFLQKREAVTQKQICENSKIPKQSINNVIITLKNDGYISIIPGDKDKREKFIVLTEKGRGYMQEKFAPLLEIEERALQKMGTELVRQLITSATAYGDFLEQEMSKEKAQLKERT